MKKLIDKSALGIVALCIFILYMLLSFVAIGCLWSDNLKMFHFGFNMAGVLLIVYPLIGGTAYVVISLIGMIKNKKIFPYLICPVFSIILWVILIGSTVAYV